MKVIDVQNVCKKFSLYKDKRPTLKETILQRGRSVREDFWALKNINLEIKQGETVGLIGQNGSGKSTLLKLLTKILYPTSGRITIQGKVSSLLELGAGFHQDFSGRENIFMNASIFGLNRKQIQQRVEDIIAFSELEEFIDSPVRTFSSGMYMRLAFAVAINLRPDILIIDEILSVGDNAFQQKCLVKINEFQQQGVTIVLVSHDLKTIAQLCDQVVWLNQGEIKEMGDTKQVLDNYIRFLNLPLT